ASVPAKSSRLGSALLRAFRAADVFRLQSLRSLLDVELHPLPLVQRAVTLRLNGSVMHEHVFTGITLDEAVPFIVVEPLDCPNFGHLKPPARLRQTRLTAFCAMFGPHQPISPDQRPIHTDPREPERLVQRDGR